MRARWDNKNRRWEASLGSGAQRVWFRSKTPGPAGEAKVNAKLDDFVDGPEPLEPGTLSAFLEADFWPWFKVPGKSAKSTRINYVYAFEKQWRDAQFMQLDELRFTYLQGQVNKMTEDGLRGKTVRNKFSALVTVLELAHRLGRVGHTEWRLVELPEIEDPVVETVDWEGALRIVGAAKGTPMEGPTWAALHLSARRNEVCGLKRPHVQILDDRAVVSFTDNRQPTGEEARLKGKGKGKKRELVVPKAWGEKLLSFAEPGAVYLFHRAGKPVHPKWLTMQMEQLCKTAEVAPKVDFHALRHAGATRLKNTGAREGLIQTRILGHVSLKTTQVYFDDEAEEMLTAFSRLI